MPENIPSPAELESLAVRAARQAAEVIRAGSSRPRSIGTKSSATDVVTQTDLDSERTVVTLLRAATPTAGFIGEESGAADRSARLQWIIDPLDGTVNFLYRVPLFAVSIAAAVDGVMVAGAVLDVPRDEVFMAYRGGGARSAGSEIVARPLTVSACDVLSASLVTTGFSYRSALRVKQGQVAAAMLGQVRDIRCFGSAALQMCWVADGRVDAYFERDIKIWDWAAGSVIAAEAGAHIELPCPENDDMVFASAPGVAGLIRPLVG